MVPAGIYTSLRYEPYESYQFARFQEISTAVLLQLQYKKISWLFTMRFCILITSFTGIILQFERKLDFDPTFYFDRTFFVSLFFTGA